MTVLRSGSATDTGLVRASNQDRLLATASLFVVADGMGGHAGGDVASRLAVDALETAFGRAPTGAGLVSAVDAANAVVWEQSLEHAELRGMGTTLTAVALVNEQGRDVLVLVNVGDSRSYRLHDGTLTQISADHSLAEEMVRTGELTPEEAAVHPHRHVLTRALGVAETVAVDLWRVVPVRGDRFLLCSDGLSNEVSDAEIAAVLVEQPEPQQAADELVARARANGGSDNITVVVVDVVIGEEAPDEPLASAGTLRDAEAARARQGAEGMALGADGLGPESGRGASTTSGGSAAAPTATAVRAGPLPLLVPEATASGPRVGAGEVAGEGTEEAGASSRADRRAARRRARRSARARRLVTVRTVLFAVLVAVVLVAAYSAVRWFDTSSYFVGLDGKELVIYQGRIGGLLWYHPVAVERTGVTTADVDPTYVPVLRGGVEEPSVAAARTYVRNLEVAPGGSSAGGVPASAPATSTTVAGALAPLGSRASPAGVGET
ncbi:MAG: Stp1/IreP family PP2C-type Ser/Thr phosphatase [Acidimicrobiales bacterium]